MDAFHASLPEQEIEDRVAPKLAFRTFGMLFGLCSKLIGAITCMSPHIRKNGDEETTNCEFTVALMGSLGSVSI